jgi:hypothetical protein
MMNAREANVPISDDRWSSAANGNFNHLREKFVVVSNMRCGSTWLISSLGALPDVATDYEFKWKVRYRPSELHVVIDDTSPPISRLLDQRISQNSMIIGSKFVFDPGLLGEEEFLRLENKFDAALRVVHLTRHFRDIFLSRHRGFNHQLNRAAKAKIGRSLEAAIVAADIQRAEAIQPKCVAPVDCYRELLSYLENDIRMARLRTFGERYLRIRYDEIRHRWQEIARFVGSRAPSKTASSIMACPPTNKLPPIDPAAVVSNIAELEPLFVYFEELRARLI